MIQSFGKKGACWRLFLCLLAALPAGAPADCAPPAFDEREATVRHVHDGDTIKLEDGRKLRLIGIDTPELGNGDEPDQPYATEARDRLRDWLREAGNRVSLAFGAELEDRYGRTLAHVFTADGNLNARLLRQGLAVAATTPPNVRLSDCYHRLDREAAKAGAGLWSHRKYQPVSASGLLRTSPGFTLVDATIDTVKETKKGIWLKALPLQAYIQAVDLDYFDIDALRKLEGTRVLLRGWQRKDRYTPASKRFMRLRHPSAIEAWSSPASQSRTGMHGLEQWTPVAVQQRGSDST